MAARPLQIRSRPTSFIPALQQPNASRILSITQQRNLHQNIAPSRIPSPTPFVPDVNTFLKLIGRKLLVHNAKIPTWKALFSLSSEQLKELGVEPPRSRKYLLRWCHKFRQGDFGIGGDATHVLEGGHVPLRIIEIPAPESQRPSSATHTKGTKKVIVNLQHDAPVDSAILKAAQDLKIKGVKIKGLHTIVGQGVLPSKGGERGKLAMLEAREGLWEHKRGVVIDGGERRRAEVRSKRRSEERKTTRG